MDFICYLASLNNTRINSFKFDIAFYLDFVGTSNEGLNTMANLGATITSRAVDRKKKKIADEHEKFVENALTKYSKSAFVLNVDDYHNIHVQRQPDTTTTSWAAHMATVITNPCPNISAIPRNWLAYEEVCMRCWSDIFLRFDRRNYKRAPLMFFF